VVVWPKVFARNRRVVMAAQFLEVRGRLEREGLVIHVMAEHLIDRSDQLRRLASGAAHMPTLGPRNEHAEGSWKPRSRNFR